ncbi:MAG: xanthine dehydrogenase accessory protein XdhC [Planctomycetota bacterium]|nr:xanthine dehydrogenase accessory protein XdhC [Planctomycetota bacterium]
MDRTQSWIEKLTELRDAGRACVMVVVTEVQGSVPRESGARMILCDGEIAWGTIGGGNLEKQAIEHATEILARGVAVSESVDYPLSEKVGQCCGGKVTLFYESYRWSRRRVVVFGAGHVGQAIGELAPWLQADVKLIDGREEAEIRPRIPAEHPYELLCIDAPEAEIDAIPNDALVLIMTHSHALDLDIVERAILRGGFPYVGLIGSERKWARFKKRLEQKGYTAERIASVRCPIGTSKTSKDPRAIAVATAAELLEVMESDATGAAEERPRQTG